MGGSPFAAVGTVALLRACGDNQLLCLKMAVLTVATGFVNTGHQIRCWGHELISRLDSGA